MYPIWVWDLIISNNWDNQPRDFQKELPNAFRGLEPTLNNKHNKIKSIDHNAITKGKRQRKNTISML